MEYKFCEGDRIRSLVNKPDNNSAIHRGDTGTVVGRFIGNENKYVYVCWDKHVGGHTCGGRCEPGRGWNMTEQDIEPIVEESNPISPDAVPSCDGLIELLYTGTML